MTKGNDIHVDRFEYILKEFSTIFDFVKPLCRKVRDSFFLLLKDGTLFKKISSNSFEKLYDFIIELFDSVITDITLK